MARCDYTLQDKRNCDTEDVSTSDSDCGVIDSSIVVPELQIYSRRFIIDEKVNEYNIPFPPDINLETTAYPQGSFITMLFDECYDLDYYKYLYAEVEDKLSWPPVIRRRLNVYPVSAKYMELDDNDGRNLFLLASDDFILLDSLLIYRQDSTALVVVDTTGVTTTSLVYDTTAGVSILTTSLVSLTTELSQLIFIYLDLLTNKNISNYESSIVISTEYALQSIYELFVIDKYFEYVSCLAVDVRLGARDPDYAGTPYDPSAGPPNSNPPGGDEEQCDPSDYPAPSPSILDYS